jgi:hypothetical protein
MSLALFISVTKVHALLAAMTFRLLSQLCYVAYVVPPVTVSSGERKALIKMCELCIMDSNGTELSWAVRCFSSKLSPGIGMKTIII